MFWHFAASFRPNNLCRYLICFQGNGFNFYFHKRMLTMPKDHTSIPVLAEMTLNNLAGKEIPVFGWQGIFLWPGGWILLNRIRNKMVLGIYFLTILSSYLPVFLLSLNETRLRWLMGIPALRKVLDSSLLSDL